MKGMELLSDLFALFMLIIVIMIICALVWIFTEIRVVGSTFVHPREATINLLFNPVKYESAFLAFLELDYQGVKMKKLINLVAIQNRVNVWVPELGKFLDVSSVSKTKLDYILPDNKFLLKIRDPEIIIVDAPDLSYLQKVSTELFLLDGKIVDLEFYVD